MAIYEVLRLKLLKIKRVKFADRRKKKLVNKDFTIISNNCWGGMIYESYNLSKATPTVGMYFMASDYIKFLSRLREYITAELFFIRPEESKWRDIIVQSGDKKFGTYPIGKLCVGEEAVELFFLHYHSEEEAKDKWKRRCQRINWNNLLVKFNDQNGCTREDLKDFLGLPFKNKIFFTCKLWEFDCEEIIKVPQLTNKVSITASHEPFGKTKWIDITQRLNSIR